MINNQAKDMIKELAKVTEEEAPSKSTIEAWAVSAFMMLQLFAEDPKLMYQLGIKVRKEFREFAERIGANSSLQASMELVKEMMKNYGINYED